MAQLSFSMFPALPSLRQSRGARSGLSLLQTTDDSTSFHATASTSPIVRSFAAELVNAIGTA
ncbi:hypothetical protein HJFPF1_08816 [Paramyrothecium foliicola]|nr:hypothetical protein HJFPF1_08816 [Paramyrothecium foliicola]